MPNHIVSYLDESDSKLEEFKQPLMPVNKKDHEK